jgi:hypothetical protein
VAYLICCEYPAHPPADGSSNAKGSTDTVLVCNVTVCALLLLSWSWVRSVLMFQLERCGRWNNDTALFDGHSESGWYCTHITSLYSTSTKTHTSRNNESAWPEQWFKIRNKEVSITTQIGIFTRLLYSQQRYQKHAKLKSLITRCQPACHTDNLPDNLEITGLRRYLRLLTVRIS